MEEEKEVKDYYGDYALVEVPAAKKRSFLSMALVIAGIVCCVPALYSGQVVGAGLPLGMAVLAIFLGFSITGILGGFTAIIGERHGVAAVMIGRGIFGRWGTLVPGMMFALAFIGWFAMNTGFFGQLMSVLVPGHFITSPPVAALWGGLLMMITALIGFRGIAFLSFLAVPIFVVILLASIAAVIADFGVSELLAIIPAQRLPFAAGITAMAGGMAASVVMIPDITRYARRDRDAFWGWFIGLLVSALIVVTIGAVLTLATGEANIPAAMIGLGLGAGALGILILGQWTTNDNNVYSSALAITNLIPAKKWLLTLVIGLVGTAVAVSGAIQYFTEFCILLGTYMPPIGGIMIIDYFIVRKYMDGIKGRKRYEFGEGSKYKVVNVAGILCFIVGGYVGSLIPGVVVVNAVVVAMVLYLLVVYICKKLNIPYQFGEVKEGKKGY